MLFSRGAHDATATFDIGNPNLGIETAKSIEIGLRRAQGPLRFELTGYYTRFNGFIFRRLTGNTCDETACVDAANLPPLELRQAIYSQQGRGLSRRRIAEPARCRAALWRHLGRRGSVRRRPRHLHRRHQRATGFRRYGSAAASIGARTNWFARINLLHAFAQNDIAPIGETPTAGYNLLKAEVTYNTKLNSSWFRAPRDDGRPGRQQPPE